jgi:Tol biopolymer transport system component
MADEGQTRLESWKEIGSYLQRDLRTARRWEKEEGLPVHRHSHKSRSSVYAYPGEIDAWRAGRKVVPEPAPALPLWKSLLAPPRSLAFGTVLMLCLVMVGNGIRPQVASAQGSTQARQIWTVPPDQTPAWMFPDGRFILYTDWKGGGLGIHDLATGGDRLVVRSDNTVTDGWAEAATVSVDGKQVAYTWWDRKIQPQGYEIRIASLDPTVTAPPRILHKHQIPSPIVPLAWSPDGKRLYVYRRMADNILQLVALSVADGSLQVLKSMGWLGSQMRLSPDGRYFVYDPPTGDGRPSSDIAILATDGSRDSVIVNHPARDYAPMWSADGRSVLFLSDRTGTPSLWQVEVENGKSVGQPKMVKADMERVLPWGISNSGALYYTEGGRRQNVHIAELDAQGKISGNSTPLTERFLDSNFHPSWSPDGQSIAYYSGRDGYYTRPMGPGAPEVNTVLVIRSAHSGQERDIPLPLQIPAYPILAEPKWFPDGRSVLVVGWVAQRPGWGYFRVNLETGKADLLHRPGELGLPGRVDLSPDGKSIFYVDSDRRLKRFTIETREDVALWTLSKTQSQIALSPDGKLIAFEHPPDIPPYEDGLYVAPAAGGEPRRIFVFGRGPQAVPNTLAWTPDQKYLLIGQRDPNSQVGSTSLWRIRADSGEAEKLGLSVTGDLKTPHVSPDGRRLVYETLEQAPVELWTLENFLPPTPSAK